MKTLAITGSSGSGKTTISMLFSRFEGTFIINTDKIAREMAETDDDYINDIIISFGEDILDNSSQLDRRTLSSIIENDENARIELNRITKKHIMPRLDKIISENADKKLIIVDVPILYENEIEDYFDKVLVIISNKNEQIKRICCRDNITEEKAEARLKIQKTNDFYKEKADYIIENYEKTLEQLYKEVFYIYMDIIK